MWRSRSAVARRSRSELRLASVLTTQHAGVAQTCVGVTYLSFMESAETDKCALYVHHSHICAWLKNLNNCISLFDESQKQTLKILDPGQHQAMKHKICDFFGVLK